MIVERKSETILADEEIKQVAAEALGKRDLVGKRVLVIIPDHTRTAPLPMLFRMLFDLLAGDVLESVRPRAPADAPEHR